MAVGDRIKRIRNFRKMTMKELGMAVGFDENSAGCGGGFPIRISGENSIKMVLTVSQLPHVEDHGFIAQCLAEYMGVDLEAVTCEIPTLS